MIYGAGGKVNGRIIIMADDCYLLDWLPPQWLVLSLSWLSYLLDSRVSVHSCGMNRLWYRHALRNTWLGTLLHLFNSFLLFELDGCSHIRIWEDCNLEQWGLNHIMFYKEINLWKVDFGLDPSLFSEVNFRKIDVTKKVILLSWFMIPQNFESFFKIFEIGCFSFVD